MRYERLSNLSSEEFKRLTGVKKPTFKVMVEILEAQYALDHKLCGKPSKLPLEDKLETSARDLVKCGEITI